MSVGSYESNSGSNQVEIRCLYDGYARAKKHGRRGEIWFYPLFDSRFLKSFLAEESGCFQDWNRFSSTGAIMENISLLFS